MSFGAWFLSPGYATCLIQPLNDLFLEFALVAVIVASRRIQAATRLEDGETARLHKQIMQKSAATGSFCTRSVLLPEHASNSPVWRDGRLAALTLSIGTESAAR